MTGFCCQKAEHTFMHAHTNPQVVIPLGDLHAHIQTWSQQAFFLLNLSMQSICVSVTVKPSDIFTPPLGSDSCEISQGSTRAINSISSYAVIFKQFPDQRSTITSEQDARLKPQMQTMENKVGGWGQHRMSKYNDKQKNSAMQNITHPPTKARLLYGV